MDTHDDHGISTKSFAARGKVQRAPSLADEVARRLGDEVRRGTLRPGDRLPTEQQMCKAFGVSRPVLREAISRLKQDGLVESFQGRGVFVADGGGSPSFRLEQPDLGNKRELQHILELLISVEVAATALAAERHSKAQLGRFRRALDAMATAVERGESGVDEDLRFHTEIVNATGNPFLIAFAGFLENRVRNLIRTARTNTARFEGLAHKVQAEHVAIYEAIAVRDPVAARRAAETHLRNAAARLRLYKEGGVPLGAADRRAPR